MSKSRLVALSMIVLMIALPVLGACGSTEATTAPTTAPAGKTAAPAATTKAAPAVGGKLVYAVTGEPDSLDPNVTTAMVSDWVMSHIGSSLIQKDPSGKYVPYLAEGWKVSADGLTWDFSLKKGIKFEDGNPCTAKDYAWTINHMIDPATKSQVASFLIGPVRSAEAVDETTLRLNLKEPYFPLLEGLADIGYMRPLEQSVVEKLGDKFGRQPAGSVGPYVFKEWVTADHITLERNPEFKWGPTSFTHGGPYYIQTIVVRIIPEMATIVAGLETGEIDLAAIETKDVERIKGTKKFQVFEAVYQGLRPYVNLNNEKAPFNDVKVRKAFNLAVDRQAMIKAIALGFGAEAKGPISPSVTGYWSGVEKIGYGFDLAQAKSLMKEAGYTTNASGMLEKDGKPLKLDLLTASTSTNVAEMLKEQYKALGVDITIQAQEAGTRSKMINSGDFTMSIGGFSYPEADVLNIAFNSSNIGATNWSHTNDPKLDEMLNKSRTLTDATQRQDIVNQIQQYIVEQAFIVPLYSPTSFTVLSNKVKGAVFAPLTALVMYLDDAYIESK